MRVRAIKAVASLPASLPRSLPLEPASFSAVASASSELFPKETVLSAAKL